MCRSDLARIFHMIAEVFMKIFHRTIMTRHVYNHDLLRIIERLHFIVWKHLVIAIETLSEGFIFFRGDTNRFLKPLCFATKASAMLVFDDAQVMTYASAPKWSLSNIKSSTNHEVRNRPLNNRSLILFLFIERIETNVIESWINGCSFSRCLLTSLKPLLVIFPASAMRWVDMG